METTIVRSTLSDGSHTYAVVFVDGSDKVAIDCYSEAAALRLQTALFNDACYAVIVRR